MKKANSDQPIANMKTRVNDLKGTQKKNLNFHGPTFLDKGKILLASMD